MAKKFILNILISLGIVIFSLESIIYIHKYYNLPQSKFAVLAIISIFTTFCFLFSIRQDEDFKKNFNVFIISILFCVFAAETAMGYFFGEFNRKEIYLKFSVNPDERVPVEVIRDGKKTGRNIYGLPKRNVKIRINNNKIIPLNAVANADTLFCNEQGTYITYVSDEFGFNNPQDIWNGFPEYDIVFIGDSFTQGVCVEREYNYAELIRQNYPNLLNLGFVGTGPLIQLATLREYLPHSVFFSQ